MEIISARFVNLMSHETEMLWRFPSAFNKLCQLRQHKNRQCMRFSKHQWITDLTKQKTGRVGKRP